MFLSVFFVVSSVSWWFLVFLSGFSVPPTSIPGVLIVFQCFLGFCNCLLVFVCYQWFPEVNEVNRCWNTRPEMILAVVSKEGLGGLRMGLEGASKLTKLRKTKGAFEGYKNKLKCPARNQDNCSQHPMPLVVSPLPQWNVDPICYTIFTRKPNSHSPITTIFNSSPKKCNV